MIRHVINRNRPFFHIKATTIFFISMPLTLFFFRAPSSLAQPHPQSPAELKVSEGAKAAGKMATDEKLKDEINEHHYNPEGKRDPFYSRILKPDIVPKPPKKAFGLEQYELDEIKLVGIIWGSSEKRAVVETPEEKAYIIKTNTPIGKRKGIVKSITDDEVIIQEINTDYFGNKIEKLSTLKLQKETEK